MKNTRKFNAFLISTAIATCLISDTALGAYEFSDYSTPVGEEVVAGSATVEHPAKGKLDVHQSSERAYINWDRFDIGHAARAEFHQPDTSSLTVNKIVGDHSDPSRIMGTLKANGQLMILDRNGVLFGERSVVDVGGIIASTGDLAVEDFMDGDGIFALENFGDAAIELNGTVTVAEAGLAAFVAPTVRNSGVIRARLGKVALASGDKVTVDLYGDRLLEIELDGLQHERLLENSGHITAQGGEIIMSAHNAASLVSGTINMSGVLDASSVSEEGGKIILAAETIKQSGEARAHGNTRGGEIEVASQHYELKTKGRLKANSSEGKGGNIKITNIDNAGGALLHGRVFADGATGGGDINIQSDRLEITKNGRLIARATESGKGGDVFIDDFSDTKIDGRILSYGKEGGGDITLKSNMDIDLGTGGRIISNTGESGAGGKIDLWANESLQLNGRIISKGKDGGGKIEVSASLVDMDKTSRILSQSSAGTGGDVSVRGSRVKVGGKVMSVGTEGGGDISAGVEDTHVEKSGRVYSVAKKSGDGGDIGIGGINATIDGRVISSGKTNGGDVSVNAYEVMDIGDTGRVYSLGKGGVAGDITLNGQYVNIDGKLLSNGTADGGDITLDIERDFTAGEAARLITQSTKSGSGGNIIGDSYGMDVILAGKLISVGVEGGGNIGFNNFSFEITPTGQIISTARCSGNGGNIHIHNTDFTVDGLIASTGPDKGGAINLRGGDYDGTVIVGPTGRIISESIGEDGIGGSIEMSGIDLEGIVSADGKAGGGSVSIYSAFTEEGSRITADATEKGTGGQVYLGEGENARGRIAGLISASGVEGGGKIETSAWVQETALLEAKAFAAGKGGEIRVAGYGGVRMDGDANVSGNYGAGTINIAGGENLSLTGNLKADAIYEGDGGAIEVTGGWESASSSPLISARGGEAGGDGGSVSFTEFKNDIYLPGLIDVSAPAGVGGDVTIDVVGSITVNGDIIASGAHGGGGIAFSGFAENVMIAPGASVMAEATQYGIGGLVQTSSHHKAMSIDGTVSVSGYDGGGTILMETEDLLSGAGHVGNTGMLLAEGTGPDGIGGNMTAISSFTDGLVSADGKAGGGNIRIRGRKSGGLEITENALVTAQATDRGVGGDIYIYNPKFGWRLDGIVNASGVDGGGEISLLGGRGGSSISETGQVLAMAAGSGIGGKVNLGDSYGVSILGSVDVSGYNGGGEIKYLWGWMPAMSGILKADALQDGDGGLVDLGHGPSTAHIITGEIYARGGAVSGDGGIIDVSDHNVMPEAILDVSAPNGNPGTIIY